VVTGRARAEADVARPQPAGVSRPALGLDPEAA
jgi:hypothetical protein